jgi:hypothetical protein
MKRKSYQLESTGTKFTKYPSSSEHSSTTRRSSSEIVRERTNFILQKLNSLSKPTHDFTPSSSSEKKPKGIFTSLHSKIENLSLRITDSYLKDIGSNISLSSQSEYFFLINSFSGGKNLLLPLKHPKNLLLNPKKTLLPQKKILLLSEKLPQNTKKPPPHPQKI